LPTTAGGELAHAVDIIGSVDAGEAFNCRRRARASRTTVGRAGVFQALDNRPQASRMLGVATGVVLKKQRIVVEECHRKMTAGSHRASDIGKNETPHSGTT